MTTVNPKKPESEAAGPAVQSLAGLEIGRLLQALPFQYAI